MKVNLAQIIRQFCKEQGVSIAELARRTSQSQQNLGQKLNRGSIKFEEFEQFLEVLGISFEWCFTMPDGEKTGSLVTDEKTKAKMALLETQVEYEKRNYEYILSLGKDIRTSLYTAVGNTDIALKNMKVPDKAVEALNKVRLAHKQITEILDEGFENTGVKKVSEKLEPEPDNSADIALLKGRRVLLADDNDMNREIARDVLEDNGLVVDEAVNGREAFEKLRDAEAGYYDCVLMDIQMPIMDGFEATEKIRQLPNRIRANVPIIAMTASAYETDRQRAFNVGMDAHLYKPIDASRLTQTMAGLM